jgi:hypothetical protein
VGVEVEVVGSDDVQGWLAGAVLAAGTRQPARLAAFRGAISLLLHFALTSKGALGG